MNTSSINYSLIRPGAIIGYRLPPSMLPLNPNKIWNGRVIRWYDGTFMLVELLEPGYHGLTEYVRIDQIAAVSGE